MTWAAIEERNHHPGPQIRIIWYHVYLDMPLGYPLWLKHIALKIARIAEIAAIKVPWGVSSETTSQHGPLKSNDWHWRTSVLVVANPKVQSTDVQWTRPVVVAWHAFCREYLREKICRSISDSPRYPIQSPSKTRETLLEKRMDEYEIPSNTKQSVAPTHFEGRSLGLIEKQTS